MPETPISPDSLTRCGWISDGSVVYSFYDFRFSIRNMALYTASGKSLMVIDGLYDLQDLENAVLRIKQSENDAKNIELRAKALGK